MRSLPRDSCASADSLNELTPCLKPKTTRNGWTAWPRLLCACRTRNSRCRTGQNPATAGLARSAVQRRKPEHSGESTQPSRQRARRPRCSLRRRRRKSPRRRQKPRKQFSPPAWGWSGYWLDRIDNNKGYEPGNCRFWLTAGRFRPILPLWQT